MTARATLERALTQVQVQRALLANRPIWLWNLAYHNAEAAGLVARGPRLPVSRHSTRSIHPVPGPLWDLARSYLATERLVRNMTIEPDLVGPRTVETTRGRWRLDWEGREKLSDIRRVGLTVAAILEEVTR